MMKGKAQRRVGGTGWSPEAQKRKHSLPGLLQPLQVILRCFHFFLRSLPKLPCLAGAPQYWALILYKTPWKEMTLSETPLCTHVLSHFSRVWLFVTLWTTAHQALLSMGFSRQEHWSGLPCLLHGPFWPRDRTLISRVSCNAGGFFTAEPPGKPLKHLYWK